MKLACRDMGGRGREGGSRAYAVKVTPANSCRMREVEGVGTLELVSRTRLLRMGGESFLLHVWCGDLLEACLLAKGSWI